MVNGEATPSLLNGVSETFLQASTSLAENLAQSESILKYKAAEVKLHADNEAMQLIQDEMQLQKRIRQQQYSNANLETDLTQLRALQSAIEANEIIQDYGLAQEIAVAFVKEINQEISQLLGVDFASLTRRSSGCC